MGTQSFAEDDHESQLIQPNSDTTTNDDNDTILLLLTDVCTKDYSSQHLEENISAALCIDSHRISVIVDDDGDAGTITIVVYNNTKDKIKEEKAADKINELIQSSGKVEWLGSEAYCSVAEEEEEVYIDEEEAIKLWREMLDRTSHLESVPSPDGVMVTPTHDEQQHCISATNAQLQRDPDLLHFDNVPRIHISHIEDKSCTWDVPMVITGTIPLEYFNTNEIESELFTHTKLIELFSDVEIRTGNRNTLIDHGFVNSKPMRLSDALDDNSTTECGRFVFTPISELPQTFRTYLHPLTNAFPNNTTTNKYTLCLAQEGFGIGMHKHNAAMFMLLQGRKKWYLTPSHTQDDGHEDLPPPKHPQFYTNESTHACIQLPGEVLYVPDQWYHEIFNFDDTMGIQALPL